MCQYGVVNNCFITICCAIKKSQNLLNWFNKKNRHKKTRSGEREGGDGMAQMAFYIIRELLQIALIIALTLQIRESVRNAGKMDRLERDVATLKAEVEFMKHH